MHHFCGLVTTKCFLATLLPCFFYILYHILFEILVSSTHILRINVFLIGPLLLHAAEQLVQGTMQLFIQE
jgi:hypothetical protein